MIVVIIAGGSGTRLWPLSTHDYPKHLLKLTNERSLLQNTYDRIRHLADHTFVITEKSHARYVHNQLPEVSGKNILAEPARRGTASCIVLALSEIKRRKLANQPVFFLWADHLVQDNAGFAKMAKEAASLAASEKKLVFTGIKPTYASTGFGYIKMGPKLKGQSNVYELDQFVEKPNAIAAKNYYKSGKYLWNTGYLTGTIETFEQELRAHAPRLWGYYNELNGTVLAINRRKLYLDFVSEPIDTALSEHVPDGLVIAGDFDWADVGSFNDLHNVSKQDKKGNYVSGTKVEMENVNGSYVRNESNKPVAVIGLDNVAVIATENGILVTTKAEAQKVGDISKRLQEKKSLKWYEKL